MYPVENFTLDSKLLHNQRLWWLWQIWGMWTYLLSNIPNFEYFETKSVFLSDIFFTMKWGTEMMNIWKNLSNTSDSEYFGHKCKVWGNAGSDEECKFERTSSRTICNFVMQFWTWTNEKKWKWWHKSESESEKSASSRTVCNWHKSESENEKKPEWL